MKFAGNVNCCEHTCTITFVSSNFIMINIHKISDVTTETRKVKNVFFVYKKSQTLFTIVYIFASFFHIISKFF